LSFLDTSMIRLLFLLLFVASPCALSQVSGRDESYIGRAGSVYITEGEFLERFELTPGLYRHPGAGLEGEKEAFLVSMIAEKLLAQEAGDRGWDRDSLVQDDLLEITKLLARDELYRIEVSRRVSVSPAEITTGVRQAQNQRLTRFLFFDNQDDASFVRARLRSGANIFELKIDSSIAFLADTATVHWGEADTTIEHAAYRLKPGQISPVLRSGDGWYILQFVSTTPNLQYLAMAPGVQRDRVADKIRSRKERARMVEYMDEVLGKSHASSPPETFRTFTRILGEVLVTHVRDSSAGVTLEVRTELRSRCAARILDTLVVAGQKVWTVGDVIDRLYRTSFSLPANRINRLPGILHATIREWVELELLAQEAMRRGCDRAPAVSRSISQWRDFFLAFAAKDRLNKSVAVGNAEVYAFLQKKNPGSAVPHVQLRELRTSSFEEMRVALGELDRGVSFPEVIERWSIDPRARGTKGLTRLFAITERPSIGEIAWRLPIGERYGPVRDSAGIEFFEVVAKDSGRARGDTSAAARFLDARRELLSMKQRRKLNLFLASAGQKRGFDIYDDRLRQIHASPIPMLTYRFLGFGGRMFAVPFVDRNVDWISVEPPSETLVP
jgi:parvulin-like peptidyl-prolyl isomerase